MKYNAEKYEFKYNPKLKILHIHEYEKDRHSVTFITNHGKVRSEDFFGDLWSVLRVIEAKS